MLNLIAKLGYDGRGWSNGLAEATAQANQASKSIAGHFANAFSGNLLTGALGQGLAGLGLGAAGALVEKLASDMKEKFQEIHIGSEMLNVDPQTFQRVKNVTQAMGSGPEAVAKSMEHIAVAQQKIAEGATDSDKLLQSFAALGISLRDLQTSEYQEIFFKIARGMQDAEVTGERLAAIHDLLGRSGAQLLPSFKQGFDSDLAHRGVISDADLKTLQDYKRLSQETASFWAEIKNSIGMAATHLLHAPGSLAHIFGEMLGAGLGLGGPGKLTPQQQEAAQRFRDKDTARVQAETEKRLAAERDAAAKLQKEEKEKPLRTELQRLKERAIEEREKMELEALSPEERRKRLGEMLQLERGGLRGNELKLNTDPGNVPLMIEMMKQQLRIYALQDQTLQLDKAKQSQPHHAPTTFDSLARIGGFLQGAMPGADDHQSRMLRATEQTAQNIAFIASDGGSL